MAKNEMTKREVYTGLLEIEEVQANSEYVRVLTNEIALLDKKKASSKKASEQTNNIAKLVVEELSKIANAVTVTNLLTSSEVLKSYVCEDGKPISNQRLSYIMNKLSDEKVEDSPLVKTTIKKVSYFTVK